MDLHLKQYLGLLSPMNKNRFTLQQYCKKICNIFQIPPSCPRFPGSLVVLSSAGLLQLVISSVILYQLPKVKNGCILYKWFKTEGIPHADFLKRIETADLPSRIKGQLQAETTDFGCFGPKTLYGKKKYLSSL